MHQNRDVMAAEGRPDFNGSNYDDAIVGDLVNFVASNKFQSMFETYFLGHALFFSDDEEHKLEYMEYYQEFHGLFEEQLEDFCQDRNMTQSEFMARCSEASTEDPKAKHYISILLSSVEYDTFVKLMKIMRPVAERRKAMEAAMAAASLEGPEEVVDTTAAGPDANSEEGAGAEAKADAKSDSTSDPNRFEGSPAKGEMPPADDAEDKGAGGGGGGGSKEADLEGSMDSKGEAPSGSADTGADSKGGPDDNSDGADDKAAAGDKAVPGADEK